MLQTPIKLSGKAQKWVHPQVQNFQKLRDCLLEHPEQDEAEEKPGKIKQKIKNCNRVRKVDLEVGETGCGAGGVEGKMLVPGQHLFVGWGGGRMDGRTDGWGIQRLVSS